MEKWTIDATDRSPKVILDRQESVLMIEGRSYPEEGMDFFDPIVMRFRSLQESENPIRTIHIRLEYYNSSTTKALAELFTALERSAKNGNEAKVIWEFEQDDDGIQEDITMFQETYTLTFVVNYTFFKKRL
jgi:hypothetical protein